MNNHPPINSYIHPSSIRWKPDIDSVKGPCSGKTCRVVYPYLHASPELPSLPPLPLGSAPVRSWNLFQGNIANQSCPFYVRPLLVLPLPSPPRPRPALPQQVPRLPHPTSPHSKPPFPLNRLVVGRLGGGCVVPCSPSNSDTTTLFSPPKNMIFCRDSLAGFGWRLRKNVIASAGRPGYFGWLSR